MVFNAKPSILNPIHEPILDLEIKPDTTSGLFVLVVNRTNLIAGPQSLDYIKQKRIELLKQRIGWYPNSDFSTTNETDRFNIRNLMESRDWTPSDISVKVEGWFKPEEWVLSGDDLSSWTNQGTGGDLSLAKEAIPIEEDELNGYDAVDLTGGGDYALKNADLFDGIGTNAWVIALMYHPKTYMPDQIDRTIFAKYKIDDDVAVWLDDSDGISIDEEEDFVVEVSGDLDPTLDEWGLLVITDKGPRVTIRINGTEQFYGTRISSNNIATLHEFVFGAEAQISPRGTEYIKPGRFLTTELLMVQDVSGGTSTWVDDLAKQIEGYFAHKYGVSSTLPSDHDYKNTAPKIQRYLKA